MADRESGELLIVWSSADPAVAREMVFMYAANSKKRGWWQEVTLLIWGPSQQVLINDEGLQDKLKDMVELGVRAVACRACADDLSTTQALEALGVEVFYTGRFLTDWLRSDRPVVAL